jgi:hypothetical protein
VHVSDVRIHCWSCARGVEVDEHDTAGGLAASGWALSHGETYCPECAQSRGLIATQTTGEAPDGTPAQPAPATPAGSYPSEQQLDPFPVSPYGSGESRFSRSVRMLTASWRVLRENPGLMAFPVISVVLSLIVGIVCFGTWTPHSHGAAGARDGLLVPSLIAAYPQTFISVYFSVALAEVLGGRLDGKQTTTAEGFSAANRRIGLIAAWSLLACTVGLALRLLQERLPLAGRIAASLFGLAWSLATLFAIPVLAYEGRGPFQTVERSTQIFKRRWGAQIGGSIGIGFAAVVLAVPLIVLLLIGIATPGGGGAALVFVAGAALFAVGAGVAAMEQIYRVFVYRSAVGLDTSAGPFDPSDLRQPLSRRGR